VRFEAHGVGKQNEGNTEITKSDSKPLETTQAAQTKRKLR